MPGFPIETSVEQFATQNPLMSPEPLVPTARAALSKHHQSPATMIVQHASHSGTLTVAFAQPDPRVHDTIERQRIVEHGAIVIAGLLLNHLENKQLVKVSLRGSKVDYFAGEGPGDLRWVLEVGGTDNGSLEGLRTKKREQLAQSPLRRPPFNKAGFSCVVRFAEASGACLELMEPEA